jgi:hypothetical protein
MSAVGAGRAAVSEDIDKSQISCYTVQRARRQESERDQEGRPATMKLAQALAERKGLQEKQRNLIGRLRANALVQEGETPTEQPETLRAELEQVIARLGELIKAINRTNVATRLADGQTIAEAITDRDMLQQRYNALDQLADAATGRPGMRYARAELRTLVTVNVAALRRELDELARQARELDVRLQEANWATELIEG